MTTHYKQFRLAKRHGDIVQQYRTVTSKSKVSYPWWAFWKWGIYDVHHEYGKWADIPIVELEEENKV